MQMKQDFQEDKKIFIYRDFLFWPFLRSIHYFDLYVSSKDWVDKLLVSKLST